MMRTVIGGAVNLPNQAANLSAAVDHINFPLVGAGVVQVPPLRRERCGSRPRLP